VETNGWSITDNPTIERSMININPSFFHELMMMPFLMKCMMKYIIKCMMKCMIGTEYRGSFNVAAKTKWLRKNVIGTVKAIEASGARALSQFNVSTDSVTTPSPRRY
jgi:hypothetical protein